MIIFPEEENTQPSWQIPASEPCCAQHGTRHLLRTAVCMCSPQQLQAQRGLSTSGGSSGSCLASDTDQCPPQRPYRKDAGGAAMATKTLICTATWPHHTTALLQEKVPQFQQRESLDFEINPTQVQVLAPPFTMAWLRAGYLPSLSITLTIYKVGVRILTSDVIVTHQWDKGGL